MTKSPVRTTKARAPGAAPQGEHPHGTPSSRRPMLQQPPTAMVDGKRAPPFNKIIAQPRVPFVGDHGRAATSSVDQHAGPSRSQRQGQGNGPR